jgi:hypothetical protein
VECSVLSSPVLAIHAVNVVGRITRATRPNRRIQFLPCLNIEQHDHEPGATPTARALALAIARFRLQYSPRPRSGGGRGAGCEPRRARNAERRTGAATQRQDRERGAQSAGDESRAGGLGRRDRAPDPPGTPPDLLELTDRALTRLITFISYATTLDCRTRLRTTATLCMPGHPPHHVCASMRRILLTYLLQVQSPHSRPRLRHVHMYGVTLSAPRTAMP